MRLMRTEVVVAEGKPLTPVENDTTASLTQPVQGRTVPFLMHKRIKRCNRGQCCSSSELAAEVVTVLVSV